MVLSSRVKSPVLPAAEGFTAPARRNLSAAVLDGMTLLWSVTKDTVGAWVAPELGSGTAKSCRKAAAQANLQGMATAFYKVLCRSRIGQGPCLRFRK